MKTQLEEILAASVNDYVNNFSEIEHDIVCASPPSAKLRLHFIKTDASGEPRFRELTRLLARYITHFCFTYEQRKDLSELERNEMFMQARNLFRHNLRSGQLGELLIYFLLETVLKAPQVIKKMQMTTNPLEERKGSDGVHLYWDEHANQLEFMFAESKIWGSFSDALRDAFHSIESFHESRTRELEINAITSRYSNLTPDLQAQVRDYIEGSNSTSARQAHACLIGFNWDEYQCLLDSRREVFVREFEKRYALWALQQKSNLNKKIRAFKHKHIRLEFFMIPFKSVQEFRDWFEQELTGI